MASASALLHWAPDSLYNSAISIVVSQYNAYKRELQLLPENVQFDVYYKLYNKGRLCQLCLEFSNLETFSKVLKVTTKRHLLHICFQALMDHEHFQISSTLAEEYQQHCCVTSFAEPYLKEKAVHLGFMLGGFLSDAGWYTEAEKVLHSCLQMCKQTDDLQHWAQAYECCVRLLHVRNANCRFNEVQGTLDQANIYIEKLEAVGKFINKAMLYSEKCNLLFAKSLYDEAYSYCCLALQELNKSLSPKITVDVLRQSAKACVVKREFKKAEILITYAVLFAKENFGSKHHKYSDALLDYGFFLLNIDAICQSVQVYQAALDIRQAVFGGDNLHVAIAHEDLAYSSYVHEYSTGKFDSARDHAQKAIDIITRILPDDHLLLASSKRVKALILEEIAIDSHNKAIEDRLLSESQELHHQSLALAKKAFGENNVQTAKHYGNLGRLYQSMQRYSEAEKMHLKAIAIKERLLGPEDYEVALSVGHLASLYNYDMKRFSEAENLYLRSIAIGRKLFGPGYSGLEYDYRGLLRLYHSTKNTDKAYEYHLVLQEWNELRDKNNEKDQDPFELDPGDDLTSILSKFFNTLDTTSLAPVSPSSMPGRQDSDEPMGDSS